ncbi:hypothetical protein [Actinomadura verrucosospora]|uniref:Uncharacterized protein n=1 Tax=Actinomadura verrucosospora TaxID=46165 RepID=A0A7D3VW09_ACTVE|nr:hypothetical protein [Actinomadura verrucosospora]QKG24038.1 hypothetical protein ACTIVE_5681 [Actinomadura verrucosospora]
MTFRGGRRRGAREEAARFETRLTAFGELLAGHPFSADRLDATHEMAVEYARALDAYEAAKRAASRDPALAGRELAAGLAALNRLNTHLVGTAAPEAPAKPKARRPEPQVLEVEAEATPVEADHGDRRPSPGDRARRPGLRDRYTSVQLAKRTGLTVAAVYLLVIALLGSWWLAFVGLMALTMGGGLAVFGGFLGWASASQLVGTVRGGLVSAEYLRTTKKVSYGLRDAPYQHFYVYVGDDGEKVTYQRDAVSRSLAVLPTRRLWLVKGGGRTGMETHLSALWATPLSFVLLDLAVPLFLSGTAIVLYTCPGLLIRVLAG